MSSSAVDDAIGLACGLAAIVVALASLFGDGERPCDCVTDAECVAECPWVEE